MPAFGAMPMECSPPSLACSDWWSSATPSSLPPWWMRRERGGFGASSLNKHAAAYMPDRRPDLEDPEVCPVSVLQVQSHLPLCFGSHQGDGQRKEGRCSSAVGRLELSKFSSMLDDGRWRLLPMSSGRDGGGRWPASPSPSVTFLVERRPPHSSRLVRHRGGSCCICSKTLACISHGDFTVPSGSSPATERFNSIAFLTSRARSFLQKARGLVVLFMF